MSYQIGDKIATREAYGNALVEFGADENIIVMDADLSKSTKTESFKKAYPERFINMGIAEGNMMATAAGIASCGKTVFASSFAMFAAHYKLDNLTVFLDFNGLQIDGDIREVMNSTPVDKKFEAFLWNVISIDAHDFNQIESAIAEAKTVKGKPTLILANSIKGKGVSYMENQVSWHGAAPNDELYEQAMAELKAKLAQLEA